MNGGLIALTSIWVVLVSVNEKIEDKRLVGGGVLVQICLTVWVALKVKDNLVSGLLILLVSLLVISALTDMDNHSLPVEYYLAAVPALIVKGALTYRSLTLAGLWPLLIVLVVFIAIGFLFRSAIGFGDILLLTTIALLGGYRLAVSLSLLSLGLTAVYGLGMVLMKRANRKTTVPFAPFVLAAMTIYIALI